MPFITAAKRRVADGPADSVSATLEFLLQNAVGRDNAISTRNVMNHLETLNFVFTSVPQFQQTVLRETRVNDYYIAANRSGLFLIETQEDAQEAYNFINNRIQSELRNLGNIERIASAGGWGIDT
jgi:hypothetical protein